MALLSDVPIVLRHYGTWGFLKRVWREVEEDHLFTWSAALAYSWLFAVFPFLLFLMTLLPYLPSHLKDAAGGEIQQTLYEVFPASAADSIWKNIEQALPTVFHPEKSRLVPRLAGLGLALWAASGGMAMTMTALDWCYEVHAGRPFYVQRPLAVGLTVVFLGLILSVICLLPLGAIFRGWLESQYPSLRGTGLLLLYDITRWTLGLLFLVGALSILYQKGPAIRRRWTWLTPGGVFCVVVWIGMGLLFKLYVAQYGKYNETYGTLGGVVVLLLLFYIDAVVLLVGAEINSEIDFHVLKVERGSRDFREAEGVHRPRRRRKTIPIPDLKEPEPGSPAVTVDETKQASD